MEILTTTEVQLTAKITAQPVNKADPLPQSYPQATAGVASRRGIAPGVATPAAGTLKSERGMNIPPKTNFSRARLQRVRNTFINP